MKERKIKVEYFIENLGKTERTELTGIKAGETFYLGIRK